MPGRYEKSGRLDRRIAIQRATTVADGYGTPVETWVEIGSTWAALSYSETGSSEMQHDAVHLATTNVIFTIRYRPGLQPTDRIVYDANNYDITRIAETAGPDKSGGNNASRRAYLTITAELRK